ncbi:MAG: hypothetical protein FWE71_08110 [Nocardioidaceae bacterium]|nr:hypothetical protein [Nocardioidaceae bacterium]MCL2613168.1 hypothetical protein [Nocardioidaceae bacterium]
MSADLGSPPAPSSPPAQRVGRPGWRDPRLWIGVVLVTASVLAGARLLAGADDTVRVWAVAHEIGAGSRVHPADLVVRRVRFGDASDLDLYYVADQALPGGLVLGRTIGAGELLARSAVRRAGEADTERVSVEVDPGRVDPDVHAGSVVDVYLDDQGDGGGPDGRVLSGVTVLAAPSYDETYATSGFRQVVLAVPTGQVQRFERRRAAMQDPVINLDVR